MPTGNEENSISSDSRFVDLENTGECATLMYVSRLWFTTCHLESFANSIIPYTRVNMCILITKTARKYVLNPNMRLIMKVKIG